MRRVYLEGYGAGLGWSWRCCCLQSRASTLRCSLGEVFMPQLVRENPPPRELLNVPREVLVRLVASGSLDELPEGVDKAQLERMHRTCRGASQRSHPAGAQARDALERPAPIRTRRHLLGQASADRIHACLRCPSVSGRPTRLTQSRQRGQELAEKISTRSVLDNGSTA